MEELIKSASSFIESQVTKKIVKFLYRIPKDFFKDSKTHIPL